MVVESLSHVWLFCNPRDCRPPGSSVHGILQAGILEWVAISFSRVYSWPRVQTHVSLHLLQAGFFFFFFLPQAQHGSASNQHITSTPSPWGIPELQLTANIQNLEYFIHKFRVLTVSLIRRSDYSKLLFSPNERKPTAVFPLARIWFLITCP